MRMMQQDTSKRNVQRNRKYFRAVITGYHLQRIPVLNSYVIKPGAQTFGELILTALLLGKCLAVDFVL
jgi:hypothetical protein